MRAVKNSLRRTVALGTLTGIATLTACLTSGPAAGETPGLDLGSFQPTEYFDQASVADGITRVLRDSYGITEVADVRCPERMQVVVGARYECTLTRDGVPKTVTIEVTKSDGTYGVSRPR